MGGKNIDGGRGRQAEKYHAGFKGNPVNLEQIVEKKTERRKNCQLQTGPQQGKRQILPYPSKRQSTAYGKKRQRQGYHGHELQGIVNEFRKPTHQSGINCAGKAADDKGVADQGLDKDHAPFSDVALVAGIPDQGGHRENIDQRDSNGD